MFLFKKKSKVNFWNRSLIKKRNYDVGFGTLKGKVPFNAKKKSKVVNFFRHPVATHYIKERNMTLFHKITHNKGDNIIELDKKAKIKDVNYILLDEENGVKRYISAKAIGLENVKANEVFKNEALKPTPEIMKDNSNKILKKHNGNRVDVEKVIYQWNTENGEYEFLHTDLEPMDVDHLYD